MSDSPHLPGNPFAESLEGYNDPRNSLEAAAILTLAYEQRTANMIASLQVVRYDGGKEILPTAEHAWATTSKINERLGLA